MLWIIPTFSTKLKTPSIAWVLLFVLSLGISPVVVANNISNDVTHISGTLDILNEFVQQDQYYELTQIDTDINRIYTLLNNNTDTYKNRVLGALVGRTLSDSMSWSDTDNIRNWTYLVARAMYGTDSPSASQKNKSVIKLLEDIYRATSSNNNGSSGTSVVSNIWLGQDVLAGNPWWATNSAFALTFPQYSAAYPNEYPNTSTTYSFPQFMSRWSAMLTIPGVSGSQVSPSNLRRNWWGYFGSLNRSADAGNSYPYTWFDWVSDAMRSNLVLQSSFASSTSDDIAHIDNLLDTLLDSVNFVGEYSISNYNSSVSNAVVSTSTYSELVASSNDMAHVASDTQYDSMLDDETPSTNSVPDLELDLPSVEGNPFSTVQTALEETLPEVSVSGSPVIQVIPAMRFGNVSVAAAYGRLLDTSTGAPGSGSSFMFNFVNAISVMCEWFWRLLGVLGVFWIVRAEWNFWSTLGGSASD